MVRRILWHVSIPIWACQAVSDRSFSVPSDVLIKEEICISVVLVIRFCGAKFHSDGLSGWGLIN